MIANNIIANKEIGFKKYSYICLCVVFLLLVGAFIIYKERIFYADASHLLFRMINDGDFQIYEHRYGIYLFQILPLAGIKMHLPLSVIMAFFSASYYLVYFLIVLIVIFCFRQYRLAVLMGLYYTIMVSAAYYYSNDEGISLLFFAFAVHFYLREKKIHPLLLIIAFIPTFFLAIWTHPAVMIVAIFLWFFYWIDNFSADSLKQNIFFSIVLIGLSVLKIYESNSQGGYDSSRMDLFTNIKSHGIFSIFSCHQFQYFVKSVIINYWILAAIFISGISFLVKSGKWLLACWTFFFAAGYFALICLTLWDLRPGRPYMECEYGPLSIICSTPFVFYILPQFSNKKGLYLLMSVFFVRMIYIVAFSGVFYERLQLLSTIDDKMKEKNFTKIFIPEPLNKADGKNEDEIIMDKWAIPAESILLSQIKGEEPQRTFIIMDSAEISHNIVTAKDIFIGPVGEKRESTNINHYYFQIDTTTPYKIVSYSMLMQ